MGKFKTKHVIVAFLVVYFIALLLTINLKYLIWDEASYVLNSLYYSGMNVPYEEAYFRPPLIPFSLSLLFHFFNNYELIGKLFIIATSLGAVVFLYKIAEELYGKRVALFSSVLFALFPLYFFYSKIIFVDVPATFLSLVSIYYFLKNSSLRSGLFLALAFLAKYHIGVLTGIVFLVSFLANKFYIRDKKSIIGDAQTIKLFFVAFLTILPWFVYNQIRLGFFAKPLIDQFVIFSGEVPIRFSYYFENLFEFFPLPYLFFILGFLFLLREKNYKNTLCLAWFFVSLIFISILSWKELRFFIYTAPALSVILGASIVKVGEKYRKLSVIVLILCLTSAVYYDIRFSQYGYNPGYGNEKFDYEITIKISQYIKDRTAENEAISTNSLWPIISYYSWRHTIVADSFEDIENSSYFVYYNMNFLFGNISYARQRYDLVESYKEGNKEIDLFKVAPKTTH